MKAHNMLYSLAVILFGLLFSFPHVRAQDPTPGGPTFPNTVPECIAWHTVVPGDGCWAITQTYGITLTDFYTWNPDITNDCADNFWLGYAYCVGIEKETEPPPESTTSTTTTATTTSTTEAYTIVNPITEYEITPTGVEEDFPPEKTQPGQPPNCDDWYLVSAWDTCESIVASNSWITRDQLLAWNPAIGSDCSGLYDGWWVCVSVPAPSITIPFGWTTTLLGGPEPTLVANYTPTVFPTVDASFDPEPTQAGIIPGCLAYYQAKDGDTCRDIVDGVYLTEEDFFTFNPALNDNCDGLWLDYWYCVVGPDGVAGMPPTTNSTPFFVQPGQISTCVRWYQRETGESCETIAAKFGTFDEEDFKAWNPVVWGSPCEGLVDGQWYCVGVPGTPTTRTGPVQTTEFPDTTPTQEGMVGGCTRLWLVGPEDTCLVIARTSGITEEQFFEWNPAVGEEFCENLVVDYYVCVSTSGPPMATTTTAPPTSTTTGSEPITTPEPTQVGSMVANCRRFYLAQSGDGCWAIANAAGIDLNDFYAWNTALGTECAGLWLGYYYCIGIAGPVTTISSGPPVPT